MPDAIWITYAWADNDEGDFDYLVKQLEEGGLRATYDKIALVPGQRLWEQIGSQITSGDLGGWAYLLTPESVNSQACREELAYALDRALRAREGFPLIGLLHGVPIDEVPPALRVRLCVDLASPNWLEEVRAGLEMRAPQHPRSETGDLRVALHTPYLGESRLYAVEFRPRFGELRYWRIAYPSDGPDAAYRGTGPAGGGGVGGTMSEFVEGNVELEGRQMSFFGSGNPISPGTAAYVVFSGGTPDFLAFNIASQPFGIPQQWIPVRFG